MRLPTGAVPATAVRGAPRLPWAWFRRTCPGCFERGSRPFRTMPRRCRRITGSGQPKPPRRVLRFRPGVPGAVCSGMPATAYAAASRRSQPDVRIWALVSSTGDGIMPVCLYLHGRTSWGNWLEKFRFRIGSGFSKQARKVPMRNWPAHARELHRSDVEGSEATRHVGPPRVGVTGACQYSQSDCWPVRPWAIRRNMRLAARQGRFHRRFAQRTRIGTMWPKHTIILF